MQAPQNWSDTPHPYIGVPKPYDLDITRKSWFGLPWYHFRCDWDVVGTTGNENYNFYTHPAVGGGAASVGHHVYRWSNTYGGGFGDAYASTLGSAFPEVSPKLVEVLIGGKSFKALEFDKATHLAINGKEVVEKYNLDRGALFNTCGTLYQDKSYAGPGSRAGASFLMVISADVETRNCYSTDTNTSPFSALLYSKRPKTNWPATDWGYINYCINNPWDPWCPQGAESDYPQGAPEQWDVYGGPESDGIEFWYSAGTPDFLGPNTQNWGYGGGSRTMMKFGPQGWNFSYGSQYSYASDYIPTREEDNLWGSHYNLRGGSDGGFLNPPNYKTWEWPKCQSTPKTGLQAILLEYVNEDIVGPHSSGGWPTLINPYVGSTVNVYAISKDLLPPAENDPSEGCPGFGSSESSMIKPVYTNKEICVSPTARTCPSTPQAPFDLMRSPHNYPAMKNHTLWHDKTLFVGGLPGVALTSEPSGNDGKYYHGFKGLLFELLMFEGVLTDSDKVKLFNTLRAKYNRGLG